MAVRSRIVRSLAGGVAALLLVAGCGTSSKESSATDNTGTELAASDTGSIDDTSEDTVAADDTTADEVNTGDAFADDTADDEAAADDTEADDTGAEDSMASVPFDHVAATDEIQSFWSKNARRAGVQRYVRVLPDRLLQLGVDDLVCDGAAVDDADVEGNAFAAYCDEGYSVVWDPELLQEMADTYGPTAPTLILAHEWGHLIMFQAGIDLPGVIAEQYADCMAGAFTAWAIDNNVPAFDNAGALDATVATAADFSDSPGDDPNDPDAHGSAFDRIRALQEGFEGGIKRCVSYETTPPSLTEAPFDPAEVKTGGNVPFKEVLTLSLNALASFEKAEPDLVSTIDLAPDAEGRKFLIDLQNRLGDSATLVSLALDASAAAQTDQGLDPEEEGELLQQSCVVGAVLRWIGQGKVTDMSLSSGDLDEAVATFTDLTDPSAAGFLFEQVAQLRKGFVDGSKACTLPS